jgi:hypothetical protein
MDRAMTRDSMNLAREARRLRAEAMRGMAVRLAAWLSSTLTRRRTTAA